MSYEIAVRALMERVDAARSRANEHGVGPRSGPYLSGYLIGTISRNGVADLNDLSDAVEAYEREVERRLGDLS